MSHLMIKSINQEKERKREREKLVGFMTYNRFMNLQLKFDF